MTCSIHLKHFFLVQAWRVCSSANVAFVEVVQVGSVTAICFTCFLVRCCVVSICFHLYYVKHLFCYLHICFFNLQCKATWRPIIPSKGENNLCIYILLNIIRRQKRPLYLVVFCINIVWTSLFLFLYLQLSANWPRLPLLLHSTLKIIVFSLPCGMVLNSGYTRIKVSIWNIESWSSQKCHHYEMVCVLCRVKMLKEITRNNYVLFYLTRHRILS